MSPHPVNKRLGRIADWFDFENLLVWRVRAGSGFFHHSSLRH
jgi:hypothetical protein